MSIGRKIMLIVGIEKKKNTDPELHENSDFYTYGLFTYAYRI